MEMPDFENLPEGLRRAVNEMEEMNRERVDKRKMAGEATALRLRAFLDKLAQDPDQLSTFTSLMAGLMIEGKNNYMTAMVYGMALTKGWDAYDFDTLLPENDGVMGALADFAENNPVQPDRIDELDLGDD